MRTSSGYVGDVNIFIPSSLDENGAAHNRSNLTVGDVVVVKEVDAHRNDWPLGRIKEPIRSDDGLVRKAHVEL